MTRKEYLVALKALCAANWSTFVAEREKGGVHVEAARVNEVHRRIADAKTIGELALTMDGLGWRRAGMMHMLVRVVVPDLPRDEFLALASLP